MSENEPKTFKSFQKHVLLTSSLLYQQRFATTNERIQQFQQQFQGYSIDPENYHLKPFVSEIN